MKILTLVFGNDENENNEIVINLDIILSVVQTVITAIVIAFMLVYAILGVFDKKLVADMEELAKNDLAKNNLTLVYVYTDTSDGSRTRMYTVNDQDGNYVTTLEFDDPNTFGELMEEINIMFKTIL